MPADIQSILKIEVPLIVQVASREMPVNEVMNIAPGTIIELPKLADEELEVMVSNKQIGMGRAVKVGENFGIRLSYVGDVRERIAALGDEDSSDSPDEAASESEADLLAEQLMAGQ